MKKAFILIDVQNDYFKGERFELDHPEETAPNAKKALDYFRKKDLPGHWSDHWA